MENTDEKQVGTVRYLLDDGRVVSIPVLSYPDKITAYVVRIGADASIGRTPIIAASGIQKINGASVIGILEESGAAATSDFAAKVYSIANLLVKKNASYGNSVLDPVRIFSRAPAQEQLLVRIDDKLSRIARGSEVPNEDTVDDLIGYLILHKLSRRTE